MISLFLSCSRSLFFSRSATRILLEAKNPRRRLCFNARSWYFDSHFNKMMLSQLKDSLQSPTPTFFLSVAVSLLLSLAHTHTHYSTSEFILLSSAASSSYFFLSLDDSIVCKNETTVVARHLHFDVRCDKNWLFQGKPNCKRYDNNTPQPIHLYVYVCLCHNILHICLIGIAHFLSTILYLCLSISFNLCDNEHVRSFAMNGSAVVVVVIVVVAVAKDTHCVCVCVSHTYQMNVNAVFTRKCHFN